MRNSAFVLRALVAVGLLVDAYIHFDLAEQYDAIKTDTLSQGALFRIEAAAALLAAGLVVALRRRASDLFALSVAAGGVVAVLLYRYVDVGAIGPIPSMYEPLWYTDKTISLIAQLVAVVAAAAAMVLAGRTARDRANA